MTLRVTKTKGRVVKMPETPDQRAVLLERDRLYAENRMRAAELQFPLSSAERVPKPSGHEDRDPGVFEQLILWLLGD
jgi:hypothetical protein